MARTKAVFPEPSGPDSATTSPARRRRENAAANASKSSWVARVTRSSMIGIVKIEQRYRRTGQRRRRNAGELSLVCDVGHRLERASGHARRPQARAAADFLRYARDVARFQ